uniref:Zinc finger protein 385C n=1 Tax=Erpetoichthys calabaricus TaxID=27687 RepID=A0A8C4TPZ4_ERPCA
MKRPLSPTEPEENGVQVDGPAPILDSQRCKREKKQQTYTLCEVCNIQLNSPAQAQIHCNGKSHQKRLKQLNKGKPTSSPGTPSQSGPLLATLPIAGRPLQPQLDLKHFMPFRLNGSSPMSLFPNFNTMDPVQKAVINHTFGIPPPLKKKQIISCNICHLRFNSTNQAEAHYKGHKHARKLKAMEAQKNKQRNPNAGTSAGRGRDREREAEKGRRRDPPPTLMETSSQEEEEEEKLRAKHKSVLEGQTSQPRRRSKVPSSRSLCKTKRIGNKGSLGVQSKAFHCEVCAIYVNSDTQLKQHMNSRRHKDRLAGKPPKPKYSPYNKSQQSTILTNVRWSSYAGSAMTAMKKVFSRCNLTSLSSQTKLALQKQLTKTLTPGFLPSPLSPAALCTMAASPLTLRHPAGTTTTLIQTPFLGPALFRPAPGPLRAAHTPILFAPY